MDATVRIRSTTAARHVVMVEPVGEEYTLLPVEELEIVARGQGAATPWFSLNVCGDGTDVYLEGGRSTYTVRQGDRELRCGHNRHARG